MRKIGGPGANRGKRSIHVRRHRLAARRGADAGANRPDRRHDVGEGAMLVAEVRDPGAIEPLDQLLLRRVDDDEVRFDGEDALDARIEQPAHPRQTIDVGGKVIVAADGRDA